MCAKHAGAYVATVVWASTCCLPRYLGRYLPYLVIMLVEDQIYEYECFWLGDLHFLDLQLAKIKTMMRF